MDVGLNVGLVRTWPDITYARYSPRPLMAMTKQASLSALTLPINAAHPRFMQREMRLVPDDHIICVAVDDGVFMASRIQVEVGQMVGKGTWFSDQCFLHLLYPIID